MPPWHVSKGLQEIAATATLWAAWRTVRRKRGGPGVDGVTLEAFAAQAEVQLHHLRHALLRGTYRPGGLKRVALAKRDGRTRHISIPNVRDRVVQQAILHVWGPRFEPVFCDCNYGFRPGRSAHQAVQVIARKLQDGARWIVEADVTDFLDQFDKQALQQGLKHVRYGDDLVICCRSKREAETTLKRVTKLLGKMGLEVNPRKTMIVHAEKGIHFLGERLFLKTTKRGKTRVVGSRPQPRPMRVVSAPPSLPAVEPELVDPDETEIV